MQVIEIVLVILLHVVLRINLQTDARGVTLWFGYDSLNRLTEKRQTDAAGTLLGKYWYDQTQAGSSNLGRRTRADAYEYRDGWGSSTTLTNTLAQNYDARGRVTIATRTVDGVAYTTQYAYDPADRVIGITYPDGEQVTTVYGSQGQPASLSSTLSGTLADSASYDEANRLRSLRIPAGGNLVRRQVYYPWHEQRGRLTNLLVGTTSTTADRLNLRYDYDAVGNLKTITDTTTVSVTVSAFGYDGLYQLTSAYGQSFAYDTASRLTNYNGLAYTPDSGHPHAVNLVNGSDRYDYDANGNQVMRNKAVPNQEQHLSWDAENRLSAVTYTNRAAVGGGGGQPPATCNGVPCKRVFLPLVMQQTPAERYSYDADGGRVRKEGKTEITRVIGPHYEVAVSVTSGQALTTTKYYDFGGQRIAVRQITGSNSTLSYLHGDHLGSTSVATSNTGAATSSVRYYAYGGQRSGNLFALPTDHGFTGQKLDRGTGLMYYGARYFDSALGTFISPDTLVPDPGNPQDLNRYAYVANNPLRYTDPSGHAWREDDSGGGWYPPLDCSKTVLCVPRASPELPSSWRLNLDPARPVLRAAAPRNQTSPLTPTAIAPLAPMPGQFNLPSFYVGASHWLLNEAPEELTGNSWARLTFGKSVAKHIPTIGVGLDLGTSVLPNAYRHIAHGDSARVTAADLVVDAAGVTVSQLGGAGVGLAVGKGALEVTKSPQAAAATGIVATFVSGVGIDFYWDMEFGPKMARPWVYEHLPGWIR